MLEAETVPFPEDRLDTPPFAPQFLPQPTNVRIDRARPRLRHITKDLRQKSRSGHNLSSVLHQQRQEAVLLASQGKCLAVQYHQWLAQIHEEVFITIERLVQGCRF